MMPCDSILATLRKLWCCTGTHENKSLKLICLNLDERGMWSDCLVAWCSQRLKEVTSIIYIFRVPSLNFLVKYIIIYIFVGTLHTELPVAMPIIAHAHHCPCLLPCPISLLPFLLFLSRTCCIWQFPLPFLLPLLPFSCSICPNCALPMALILKPFACEHREFHKPL